MEDGSKMKQKRKSLLGGMLDAVGGKDIEYGDSKATLQLKAESQAMEEGKMLLFFEDCMPKSQAFDEPVAGGGNGRAVRHSTFIDALTDPTGAMAST